MGINLPVSVFKCQKRCYNPGSEPRTADYVPLKGSFFLHIQQYFPFTIKFVTPLALFTYL